MVSVSFLTHHFVPYAVEESVLFHCLQVSGPMVNYHQYQVVLGQPHSVRDVEKKVEHKTIEKIEKVILLFCPS